MTLQTKDYCFAVKFDKRLLYFSPLIIVIGLPLYFLRYGMLHRNLWAPFQTATNRLFRLL